MSTSHVSILHRLPSEPSQSAPHLLNESQRSLDHNGRKDPQIRLVKNPDGQGRNWEGPGFRPYTDCYWSQLRQAGWRSRQGPNRCWCRCDTEGAWRKGAKEINLNRRRLPRFFESSCDWKLRDVYERRGYCRYLSKIDTK